MLEPLKWADKPPTHGFPPVCLIDRSRPNEISNICCFTKDVRKITQISAFVSSHNNEVVAFQFVYKDRTILFGDEEAHMACESIKLSFFPDCGGNEFLVGVECADALSNGGISMRVSLPLPCTLQATCILTLNP